MKIRTIDEFVYSKKAQIEALKKLIPDSLLRMEYCKTYAVPYPVEDKDRLYLEIARISDIVRDFRTWRYLIITAEEKLNYTEARNIEAGLKVYNHSADFLRWLLEHMSRDEFYEGVVLVEKRLAEIGAHNERGRFEL